MKKVIAIAMADLHTRTTRPQCRKDDYFEAMKHKLDFIAHLCRANDCILIDAGDLFDSWKGSPRAESMLLQTLPQPFYSIPGNHEMPYHNSNLIEDSSFNVLHAAGRLLTGRYHVPGILIDGYPYSKQLPVARVVAAREKPDVKIAVYHGMVWPDGAKPDIDGIEGFEADAIAKIFYEYDFVIAGHNHETFSTDKFFTSAGSVGPVVINPGSVMRSSISQMQHEPSVFKLFDDGSFERAAIPIEADVFSEEVYKRKQDRDSRMEAFVEQLSSSTMATADFEKNMDRFLAKNKIKEPVCNVINKIIGGAK